MASEIQKYDCGHFGGAESWGSLGKCSRSMCGHKTAEFMRWVGKGKRRRPEALCAGCTKKTSVMTKSEAKRRVCHGAAAILDNEGANEWLGKDGAGEPLSLADEARMRAAFDDLVSELRRRGGVS